MATNLENSDTPVESARLEPWMWSIVLGLLSGLSLGLAAIPGFILGVVTLRKDGESKANWVGAFIGIALCSLGLVLLFVVGGKVVPLLARMNELGDFIESAQRVENLTKSIQNYALKHEGLCPPSWEALLAELPIRERTIYSPLGDEKRQYLLLMPGAVLDDLPEDTILIRDPREIKGKSVAGYPNGKARVALIEEL